MPDILLSTINAKYHHASLGLRYLMANLGSFRDRAAILEFESKQAVLDVAAAILAERPRVLGLGVYIWNAAPTTELVAILKRAQPELIIVLGGPEVSYEYADQPIVQAADYLITGEGDQAFAKLCQQLLLGNPPAVKVIAAPLPELDQVQLPYDYYDHDDLANRVVYVEASRGCPFRCEFCLSSLDIPLRGFPLPEFLAAMGRLLDRGLRQFKFVDRTFNLNLGVSQKILQFFWDRYRPGLFLHFEMIPDRLPGELREMIARFPAGAVQFEIGIQTFNPEVAHRIGRRQDYARLADNFRFLREHTGVHLHADLIAGLPGETWDSFGHGFDQLVALRPHEIQVGILKRLRGTPIIRHDAEWRMVYNPNPPYEVLLNRQIDFETMQRLRNFARYWDLVGNSGNFIETTPLLWADAVAPFAGFMAWSDWLYRQTGSRHGIALTRLVNLLFEYLTRESCLPPQKVARALYQDYRRGGRTDLPPALRPHLQGSEIVPAISQRVLPKRQRRHTQAVDGPAIPTAPER